ncbi:mitochondrial substrate carrier family protein [Tieghemostelium lacteum]|uniref:Mitochondrial substrate carrier family protein n=1 Tax=Tieghemostelium lacteum TaxID=361077 RepID=A0A151Z825_TIELA|nr:mitochondrial substrate carrier family protein [Tieghemostelium lacteum]|eukprot:KYQ90123.1 mitochondrial substrate carrier family protein [Tieghemostelium lacteum]
MSHDHGSEGGSFYVHLIAGASAGFAEHCGMYPIDTIKTHIQAIRPGLVGVGGGNAYIGALQITRDIISKSGFTGLFRGLTAVAAGAAPSHAVHFSIYELLKHKLIGGDDEGHHPVKVGLAGVIATMSSEAVACPMDVVKQRLQLQLNNYRGLFDCTKKIWHKEGLRGFYAGYTTTLVMTVPYNIIYFPAYESLKKIVLNQKKNRDEKSYELLIHLFAGGGAGMLAAAITNPFDVAKTRLQTQGDVGKHYKGMIDALRTIWAEEGSAGYLRGMKPRIVFHSMSSAIVWSVYEYIKFVMGE